MNNLSEREFAVHLSDAAASELEAFCRVHYDANRSVVAVRALRAFIDGELKDNPAMEMRFREIRARLRRAGHGHLRLVTSVETE